MQNGLASPSPSAMDIPGFLGKKEQNSLLDFTLISTPPARLDNGNACTAKEKTRAKKTIKKRFACMVTETELTGDANVKKYGGLYMFLFWVSAKRRVGRASVPILGVYSGMRLILFIHRSKNSPKQGAWGFTYAMETRRKSENTPEP